MTWSHPRGFDPMVATSKVWKDKTGVEISWSQRSLQDFESFPVEELAREYDLIVIDHPHVGQITDEGCLAPLDVAGRESEQAELARHSVGQSYPSYHWAGRQWAFPIDAATQVQAYRADIVEGPATCWADVIGLAKADQVVLPMLAPHSLMTFYTLAGNLGHACNSGEGALIGSAAGAEVIEHLRELVALIAPSNFAMDPIMASEAMARQDAVVSVMPYGYGYLSYALKGFRPGRLKFADIPDAGGLGPVGSALGGTGIAVSAFSTQREAAIDYAYWVAGGEIQRTLYADAGGQPGHGLAWEDDAVNAAVDGFYRDTRRTLEGAWVRPRHNGYMAFQHRASQRLNAGLLGKEAAGAIVADLNRLYRESF
ncbi:MAG TPA: extracellular solute-binding protein [Devosia sp.]|nr:extracellular solute-binding protein [Devosia sp.]